MKISRLSRPQLSFSSKPLAHSQLRSPRPHTVTVNAPFLHGVFTFSTTTRTHRQAAKQAMMRTKGRRWSTVIIHTITHTRGAITTRPAPGPTHAVHNSTPKTNLSYSSYFCHIFPLVRRHRRRHTAELQLSQAAYVIMIL